MVQFYPELKALTLKMVTTQKSPKGVCTVGCIYKRTSDLDGNLFVIVGYDAAGNEKLVLYDVAAGKETDLLPNGGFIIDMVSVNAKAGKVYFSGAPGDGMSLTDSDRVLGTIDIETLDVKTTPSVGSINALQTITD